jgi:hypothetical protein
MVKPSECLSARLHRNSDGEGSDSMRDVDLSKRNIKNYRPLMSGIRVISISEYELSETQVTDSERDSNYEIV